MASSDFGELLQAAEQLTSEFDPSMTTSDLPRVERNLHQLVRVIAVSINLWKEPLINANLIIRVIRFLG